VLKYSELYVCLSSLRRPSASIW